MSVNQLFEGVLEEVRGRRDLIRALVERKLAKEERP